jgi:hypothetical protein
VSDTLLPCPFCGASKAMMLAPTCRPETPYNPADRLFPIVRCMACYCEVAGANEDYRGTTAIAAWNHRPLLDELDASKARIAEGWQDIATAPKDGSRFLAMWGSQVVVGRWGNGTYNRKTKSYDGGWSVGMERNAPLTHWRPLPPPPHGDAK